MPEVIIAVSLGTESVIVAICAKTSFIGLKRAFNNSHKVAIDSTFSLKSSGKYFTTEELRS